MAQINSKPLKIIVILTGLFLGSFSLAGAVSTFITGQGGTGTTTPSGILYGDNGATSHLNTVTIGTGCTFSGGTLNCPGTGSSYPFPNQLGGGNATSSLTGFSGGILVTASSTFTALTNFPSASSWNTNGTITVGGTSGSATSTFATSISVGTGYSGYPELTFNADPNTGIDSTAPDVMNFVNAGINTMTLTSANRVGIGITSPSVALAVNGTASSSALVVTGLSGLMKANGTSAVTVGANGTDYTLLTAQTCTNQAITALTAAGGSTCSSITDSFISGTIGVSHGGTGQSTFTSSQLLYGNGTNALSSVGTTTATLGLGLTGTLTTINNVAQSLSVATSSLYTGAANAIPYFTGTNTLGSIAAGTNGFVLGMSGGVPTWLATSSIQNITLTTTGTSGAATLTGNTLNIPNYATGGSAFPFTPTTNFGIAVNSTSTPLWDTAGLMASSTSYFPLGTWTSAGDVGIGSTSPFANLAISANAGDPTYEFAIGSTTSLVNPLDAFRSNGSLYIQNNNVNDAIGINPWGSNTNGNDIAINNGSATFTFGVNAQSGGGTTLVNANNGGFFLGNSNSSGGIVIDPVSSSGPIIFGTGGTGTDKERMRILSNGRIGIGTTTPAWLLDVATSSAGTLFNKGQLAITDTNAGAGLKHWLLSSVGGIFTIGTTTDLFATSSPAALTILNNGQLSTTEQIAATSTAMTIDWNTTPNQVVVRLGTSATTIGFNNASTTGMTKRVVVCNPGSTAGALTWSGSGFDWAAGTIPTQTTTADHCDIYSFIVSAATSTTKVMGAASTNF